MNTISFLNIQLTSIALADLLPNLRKGIVFTPNVDHFVRLNKDKEFHNCYLEADWVLCDSKIVSLATKFLKTPVKEVIPGSSLLPAFYNYHKNNKNIKLYLLGAMPGVAAEAMRNINATVGRQMVVDVYSPPIGFEKDEQECKKIISQIRNSDANVLVVGLGAPKQEKWITKYKAMLPNIDLFMALGATIDFEARHIRRAPKIIQHLHLEWFYRLCQEPRRLAKRYLIDDLPFFELVLKQKLDKQ